MVTIGGTSVSEAESGIACPAAGVASVTQPCHCDNLRKFAYFRDATTGATQNIFVIGYEEDI
jgi:hypothetical protein